MRANEIAEVINANRRKAASEFGLMSHRNRLLSTAKKAARLAAVSESDAAELSRIYQRSKLPRGVFISSGADGEVSVIVAGVKATPGRSEVIFRPTGSDDVIRGLNKANDLFMKTGKISAF